MLGDTVKEARRLKGFTQVRLAEVAGVSRRHLAALEKGANVSIDILQRVAAALELKEIPLGDLEIRGGKTPRRSVNVPLLTDTIRQARAEAERAQAILASAEDLLGGAADGSGRALSAVFPRLPVRRIELRAKSGRDLLRETKDWREVTTAGEIRHGAPVDEERKETITVPESLVDDKEIVFRVRGDEMRDQGIEDGDLLVVEPRPRGRAATGELVIGRIGRDIYLGRWWQKHGRKALMTNGLSEVTVGRSRKSLKIVAAVNQIVRIA